ncbi:MAG: hypothetical protein CVT65_14715 [Actinobacteria bacterium HGW-Actinobacteria-5]|nr:MAG: hypothetical protein CVT65_14715 [Actinobacteria bacterium HGW-Actinobacteria-5]
MAEDLARVRRWLGAGGTVRPLTRSTRAVTLALCSCDTGAEMERLTSSEPALLATLDELLAEARPGLRRPGSS